MLRTLGMLLGVAVILFGISAIVYADTATDAAGASAMPHLRIQSHARPVGMGEAFTGLADDIALLNYNTAGLAQLSDWQLLFTGMDWIYSTRAYYFYFGKRFSIGGLGVGIDYFDEGKTEQFLPEDENYDPDTIFHPDNERELHGYFMSTRLGYALPLIGGDKPKTAPLFMSVGIEGRWSAYSLASKQNNSFMLDIAFLMLWHSLYLGFTAQNFDKTSALYTDDTPVANVYRLGVGFSKGFFALSYDDDEKDLFGNTYLPYRRRVLGYNGEVGGATGAANDDEWEDWDDLIDETDGTGETEKSGETTSDDDNPIDWNESTERGSSWETVEWRRIDIKHWMYCNFVADVEKVNPGNMKYHFGSELWLFKKTIALRAGWQTVRDFREGRISFGLGFVTPPIMGSGERRTPIEIDYAYLPMKDFDIYEAGKANWVDQEIIHRISLLLHFGAAEYEKITERGFEETFPDTGDVRGAEELTTIDVSYDAAGNMIINVRVNFDFDKTYIRDEDKLTLNKVLSILQEYPECKISLSGHTDSIGEELYNFGLSQKRAEIVYNYMIDNDESLKDRSYPPVGYGESRPVASNNTLWGRLQNRRVDFIIYRAKPPAGTSIEELPPVQIHSGSAIMGVEIDKAKKQIQIICNGLVEYKKSISTINGKKHIIMDLEGIVILVDDLYYPINSWGTTSVRLGHHQETEPNYTRIVIDITKEPEIYNQEHKIIIQY